MQNKAISVHGSKFQFRLNLVVGLFLSIVSVFLGYQLALGKSSWGGFLAALLFALFSLALAVMGYSNKLRFEDGYLIQSDVFKNQRVELSKLSHAERYMEPIGKYPAALLKLEDDEHNILILRPGDYEVKDIEALVALISPYIFITKVDKNFMDLQFSVEQGLNIPKTSASKALTGTLLYVLLPCLILTLALIAWAFITKQSVFSK